LSTHWSRYESAVEQQIRMAQARGDFDNLPGVGKPLPDRGELTDELWWLKEYVHREGLSGESLLPPGPRIAGQVERLPDTVAKLPSERAVREAVAELNEQVADYMRTPSGPYVPVRPVDAERMVARWRSTREPAKGAAADTGTQASPRVRRWRWFGRRA
jgi:hypothetical protein